MLLSCGDALIDFLPVKGADGKEALRPTVGGSCLNIAIGIARLGAPAGFVGGISTDLFGRMIADHAQASGVIVTHAMRLPRPTTLAFVRQIDGGPQYAFYDQETATRHWTYVRGSIRFDDVDAIHFGSTTLVEPRGSAEALAMVQEARGRATVSFDPNCRPTLVHDKSDYVRRMQQFEACADIVRLSDEDFAYLHSGDDYDTKAKALLESGTSLVIVTRGLNGARAWHRQAGTLAVEAPATTVVDTIGAGDSFQSALLFALWTMNRVAVADLARMTADELARTLTFATACAAITCGRAGADPPRASEVPTRALAALKGE
jgi:fructokinase